MGCSHHHDRRRRRRSRARTPSRIPSIGRTPRHADRVSRSIRTTRGKRPNGGFRMPRVRLPLRRLHTGSSSRFHVLSPRSSRDRLGYKDSSPLTVTASRSPTGGEGLRVAYRRKRSSVRSNTSYYRLMLKMRTGPEDVAGCPHQAGSHELPGCPAHSVPRRRVVRPTTEFFAIHNPAIDMARRPTRRWPTHASITGRTSCKSGQRRLEGAVRRDQLGHSGSSGSPQDVRPKRHVAMQPIAGTRAAQSGRGRPSRPKTGKPTQRLTPGGCSGGKDA